MSKLRVVTGNDDQVYEPPLSGGGGGDNSGGMEDRIARLEKRADAVDAKLDKLIEGVNALRVDLAEVKGQLKHLPTTLHLIGFALAVFAAAGLMRYFAT